MIIQKLYKFKKNTYKNNFKSQFNYLSLYILKPGYEFTVGIKFANKFDLLTGINSSIGHLFSSPYYYELNFQQINYPLRFRYHFGNQLTRRNFILIGVFWGKILQRELSRHRSIWQHDYLEDWNDISPFSIEFGAGKSFFISEKSNLLLNPFLSYELSENEILKGFYNPISLVLKLSYELNLK